MGKEFVGLLASNFVENFLRNVAIFYCSFQKSKPQLAEINNIKVSLFLKLYILYVILTKLKLEFCIYANENLFENPIIYRIFVFLPLHLANITVIKFHKMFISSLFSNLMFYVTVLK